LPPADLRLVGAASWVADAAHDYMSEFAQLSLANEKYLRIKMPNLTGLLPKFYRFASKSI
jgi:hypothetical protein